MKAPRILSGFRDLLPQEMAQRQRVLDAIRKVFERHGFEPLETPSLEYYATLAGKDGGESEMLMYHFLDHGQRHVGLIYDLTVPLARFMASHPEIPKPFKRYQIQRVWRAESPQRGRYREFTQCDFDIVGSESMMADAQVIAVLDQAVQGVGFQDFTIVINHRQVLQGILEMAGVPDDKIKEAIIAIDKLDKVGEQGVSEELKRRDIPGASRLLDAIMISGDPKEVHSQLVSKIGNVASGREGLAEMEELLALVGSSGQRLRFQPSLARGQGYYTGPVYEVKIERPKIGSIAGGGRYDGLIGIFSGNQIPATGASFGIDRMTAALAELGQRASAGGIPILVCHFGPGSDRASLEAAEAIRNAGLACDVYAGRAPLGKQLKYADRKGSLFAVIIGEDEVRSGKYIVKDLKANVQEAVACENLGKYLEDAMARSG